LSFFALSTIWAGWFLGHRSDLAAHKKLAVSCHFAIFLSPVNFDFHFILFLTRSDPENLNVPIGPEIHQVFIHFPNRRHAAPGLR
jgi:hypothetical protein